MKNNFLNAVGKGEYSYDFKEDILFFKIRNRDYKMSLDFDNIVIDVDKEGFITGLRVFDASKVFRLPKVALNSIKEFEFNTKVSGKVITVQLRFMSMLRNKRIIQQGQDFVRDADTNIKDSEVKCTIA